MKVSELFEAKPVLASESSFAADPSKLKSVIEQLQKEVGLKVGWGQYLPHPGTYKRNKGKNPHLVSFNVRLGYPQIPLSGPGSGQQPSKEVKKEYSDKYKLFWRKFVPLLLKSVVKPVFVHPHGFHHTYNGQEKPEGSFELTSSKALENADDAAGFTFFLDLS